MSVLTGEFEKNLKKAEKLVEVAKTKGAELVVFPEMFLCGFNYKKNLDYLESFGNAAEQALCAIAERNDIALCGTLPHLLGDALPPTNRLLFIDKKGKIVSHYDKLHLFSVFNENKYVTAGDEVVVADTHFGKAGFAICYDLRFPELFIQMTKRDAKFIIICAAFPHPRSEHWRVLCRARAIENQCFVIAVNQGGEEILPSGKIKYFGLSAVIDPWGGIVAECGENTEDDLVIADINLEEVDNIRSQIPALADRRDDIY